MTSTRARVRDLLLATPLRGVLLKEPVFVIVGTGRSGTRFISRVLTQAGIRTGHESWWNPYERRVTTRLVGEASWCAVFNTDGYRGHVFHQIRNPRMVVASLALTELNREWHSRDNELFYKWRQRNIELTGDPIRDAMAVVVRWHRESERASEWSYRLEDVDENVVLEIAARAGVAVRLDRVRRALAGVSTTTNQRKHQDLSWDELPDGDSKSELVQIAKQHGYI